MTITELYLRATSTWAFLLWPFILVRFFIPRNLGSDLPAAAEVLGMSVREGGSCLSQKCSSPEQTDPGRRRLAGACTVSAYNLLREANPEPYPSEPEIKGLDL